VGLRLLRELPLHPGRHGGGALVRGVTGDRFTADRVQLPLWVSITSGVGAAVAGVEPGLRLRYQWLLDGAAN
jgi:hypothetical protein